MKKKDFKQARDKKIDELKGLIEKIQVELVKLKVDLGSGKLKDVHLPVKKGRQLAQLKTILREKELDEIA